MGVAKGNIQQQQNVPFSLVLLHLRNVTTLFSNAVFRGLTVPEGLVMLCVVGLQFLKV